MNMIHGSHPRERAQIRIVLADEYPILRLGIEKTLVAEPDMVVVDSIGDGKSALDAVERHQPDVLIIDDRLPVFDGHAVMRELKRRAFSTRVIVLSGSSQRQDVLPLLANGVNGYILKRDATHYVVDAIRGAMVGRVTMAPDIATLVLQEHYGNPNHAPRFGDLTTREEQVLALLAEGYSNSEIARQLGIGIKTVGTHRSNLYQKLGVHNLGELIVVAVRRGLVTLGASVGERRRETPPLRLDPDERPLPHAGGASPHSPARRAS